jgi:hypothetical protein
MIGILGVLTVYNWQPWGKSGMTNGSANSTVNSQPSTFNPTVNCQFFVIASAARQSVYQRHVLMEIPAQSPA